MKRKQKQEGVALVVTLILLSVITFLAVTFLVLSRRNAEHANTMGNQIRAKNAADEALNKAISQIIASMLAKGNGFEMPLMVSTNLMNSGFTPLAASVTNIAYNYANGAPLALRDQMQMLNNLLVLPRAPVFVNLGNGLQEFRYYLDLNQNGTNEPNGWVAERDQAGQLVFNPTNAALLVTNVHVGDPEWVGILDHPDQRHGASNQFISRFAFICLPAGNALDVNFIHNEAKQISKGQEGYLRNEGVGGWENNLAAFLYALNPRQNGNGVWDYIAYDTNTAANAAFISSQGSAFDDANSLLQYRYNGDYANLKTFRFLYGIAGSQAIANDGPDWYCRGPLMNSLNLPADNDGSWAANINWSGGLNTNQYFSQREFFGNSPYLANFRTNLLGAGLKQGTTNAYTFYRMLEQLATDGGRDTGKLNLNFANRNGYTSTNFRAWQPVEFFTNAANALLGAHPDLAGSTIKRIQLYPNNEYTPAVHQLLQMAANIYDSTRSKITNAPDDFDYPSVFRPVFRVENTGEVYIDNYIEVGPQAPVGTNTDYQIPPLSLPDDIAIVRSNLNSGTNINIYGVPWIVGARKGFPNLNEVSFQTVSQITRKMQIVKPSAGAARATWHTNIQYTVGVTNYIGVEAWNSYSNAYPRSNVLIVADNMTMQLTNELGTIALPTNTWTLGVPPTVIAPNTWPGFISSFQSNSFILPVLTNLPFVPGLVYRQSGIFTKIAQFETTAGYPQPDFGLNVTNRLRFILLDGASGRVIDYVHLDGMDRHRKLIDELPGTDDRGPGGVWDTDRTDFSSNNAVPVVGMLNQIQVSLNEPDYYNGSYATPVTSNEWAGANVQAQGFNSVKAAVDAFRKFYNGNSSSNAVMQVPFTPTRTVSRYYTWQANDPLVHYTLSDLSSGGTGNPLVPPGVGVTNYWQYGTTSNSILPDIGRVNYRYLPWEGRGNLNSPGFANEYKVNVTIKDPLIYRSDDWNFPSNKFPNIGWLGRVHRGTPWQTIYMKSDGFPRSFSSDDWQDWTGNHLVHGSGNNAVDDAAYIRPTNDWGMFDLFTTSPNDNATRGQLSINQTNMAAWAALFSGVIVNTNDANYSPVLINPGKNPNIPNSLTGENNAVRILARGIANRRNDLAGNVFTRVGDILSVPELTMQSPFLDTSVTNIPDALYERLPQQIMSLLKVGKARYVIYSYGQALKPAPNSIFTGRLGIDPRFTGTCTNYQVVGEVVTRTVVRFEPSSGLGNNSFTRRNPTRNPVMVGQDFGDPNNGQQPTPRAVIESFTVLGPD